MKKNNKVISAVKAARKASREEEIANHGKQISMVTRIQKPKTIYKRIKRWRPEDEQ